jgi:hypothetical protein
MLLLISRKRSPLRPNPTGERVSQYGISDPRTAGGQYPVATRPTQYDDRANPEYHYPGAPIRHVARPVECKSLEIAGQCLLSQIIILTIHGITSLLGLIKSDRPLLKWRREIIWEAHTVVMWREVPRPTILDIRNRWPLRIIRRPNTIILTIVAE